MTEVQDWEPVKKQCKNQDIHALVYHFTEHKLHDHVAPITYAYYSPNTLPILCEIVINSL